MRYQFHIYTNGYLDVRNYDCDTRQMMKRICNNLLMFADIVEVKNDFNRVVYRCEY